MAKRFTDSNKFRDPWYRKLPAKGKIAWEFLLSECDHAGLWKEDLEAMSFLCGFKIDRNDLNTWFEQRVIWVKRGHIFIPKFLNFQYNLTSNSKVIQSAISKLSPFGIDITNGNVLINGTDLNSINLTVSKELANSYGRVKDKDKDKAKAKVLGKKKVLASTFEKFWAVYPRKVKKIESQRVFEKELNTSQFENFLLATQNYLSEIELLGTEKEFIKHPTTFMRNEVWKDYLEWKPTKPRKIRTKEQIASVLKDFRLEQALKGKTHDPG